MTNTRTQFVFFVILLVIVFSLLIFIFWSYLAVLAISAMIAVILEPLYAKIQKHLKIGKDLSALLTIVLFLIIIIIPLTFIANQLIAQANDLYSSVTSGGLDPLGQITNKIDAMVGHFIPGFSFDARQYIAGFSAWISSNLQGFLSSTVGFLIKISLSLVAIFYFLRDGDMFKKYIIEVSPLPPSEDQLIITSLNTAIRSLIFGTIIVAIIQGVTAGIGYHLFGVPNATLWGVTTAMASFVPGVGTPLIWIPVSIYLFVTGGGSYLWLGQLLWGLAVVGIIDNYLSPIIMQRGIHIHPILILFSILGGLSLFGPEGFLLGPLVLSLFIVLLRVMKSYSGANQGAAASSFSHSSVKKS